MLACLSICNLKANIAKGCLACLRDLRTKHQGRVLVQETGDIKRHSHQHAPDPTPVQRFYKQRCFFNIDYPVLNIQMISQSVTLINVMHSNHVAAPHEAEKDELEDMKLSALFGASSDHNAQAAQSCPYFTITSDTTRPVCSRESRMILATEILKHKLDQQPHRIFDLAELKGRGPYTSRCRTLLRQSMRPYSMVLATTRKLPTSMIRMLAIIHMLRDIQ